MNKALHRLIIAVCSLLLSGVMLVSVTYAWMTISEAPVVEGIQITISGGTVINIAPDVTEVVDGVTYHYPGKFSSNLKFHESPEYAYLNDIYRLSPVSTADGLYWYVPEYYDVNSPEFREGLVAAGQLRDYDEFTVDTTLDYANMTEEMYLKRDKGGYAYVDFWVVSPGTDYTLRISRGDDNTGSYLIELMDPVKGEDGKYTLGEISGYAAASARVGFLVNDDIITDSTMLRYQSSPMFSEMYTKLRGIYHDQGDTLWDSVSSRFTVYEPNADLHPGGQSGYIPTTPIGYNSGITGLVDISDRTTVQLTNTWKETSSEHVSIKEIFEAAIYGKELDDITALKNYFYHNYMQEQFLTYINKGQFIKSAEALSAAAVNGAVSAETLETLEKGGATDDVYITKLEKNVPQRIRMFIWLEGMDVDCVNDAGGRDFALSIEFAGSN